MRENHPKPTKAAMGRDMNDDRAPICPTCGVTMLPAELSAHDASKAEWVCVECEETGDPEAYGAVSP